MKCKGCGVELQYDKPEEIGYSPKKDAEYCQRCYRLTHYGQLSFSYKEDISSRALFRKIEALDALIVWIVDLFDLESGFRQDVSEFFEGKDILMVCTKRDLLPDSVGQEKLGNYILSRLKEKKISVNGIVVVGEHGYDGDQEILEAIDVLRKGRDVVLVGTTNAGKSTVIKNVFRIDGLTISRYPGTTMDVIELPYEEYRLYDTPGFNQERSVQILVEDKDMDYVVPKTKIKPKTFQITSDQSFALGGIARVDITGVRKASVSCYFADKLEVHRGKVADADRLWQKNKGGLLKPVINGSYFKNKVVTNRKYNKMDIVIVGLGWLCISGEYEKAEVSGSDRMEIVIRKAMI